MVRVCCWVGVLLAASLVVGQDFSADVVNARGSEGIKKIYSTKDKVRYEVEGQNKAMGSSAVIVDEAQNKWLVVLAERHMYMDSWPTMMKKPIITQYWHVQDVNDACPQWKKLAEQVGTYKNWGSCTKIGSDTVNGRSTVNMKVFPVRARRTTSGWTRSCIASSRWMGARAEASS
jgi:hypothetical protein